jgi:hypothetical protein
MHRSVLGFALAVAVGLAAAPAAQALTYCVGTTQELRDALNAAAASGADDEIRVRTGFYSVASRLTYNSPNGGWMFVLGGYFPANGNDCGGRTLSASATVLDGGGASPVMGIYFNPPQGVTPSGPRYGVDNLTLQNGVGTGFVRGGGLDIAGFPDIYTELWLDNLIVRNNSGYFSGGINASVGRGLVRVLNSFFDGNRAPTSAFGHLALNLTAAGVNVSHGAIVANNTFVNGQCQGDGGRGCGIHIGPCGGVNVQVSNNVFWNNQISDVNIEGCTIIGLGNGTVNMAYNRAPTLSGGLAPTVSNAIAIVPDFVNPAAGNYTLPNNSPYLNAGLGPIPLYSYNSYDVAGGRRLRNVALDLGAFENQDAMLSDGFENSAAP